MAWGKTATQEEFEAELETNIKTLEQNIGLLENPEDRRFARSLTDWYEKYGSLTDKQCYRASQFWAQVNSLGAAQASLSRGTVVKANNAPSPTLVRPPHLTTPNRINGLPLLERFKEASSNGLKFPKIVYTCTTEETHSLGISRIVLYLMGAQSKAPGCINITNGSSYPEKIVLGRIQLDGSVILGQYCEHKPPLQDFMKKLIENFVEVLSVNGIQTGHCCFCSQELTNKESLKRGYGPICAAKYGLPWDDSSLPTSLDLGL